MLRDSMVQEIVDLKLRGLSVKEILEHYEKSPITPPSLPTIRKYYKMDVVPDMGVNLSKDKVYDAEPWKSAIITILEYNPDCNVSSIYDVLIERFVENDKYDCLPGSDRTLRSFINYLKKSGQVNIQEKEKRIYEHVFDTPPGQQMLIDFGELRFKEEGLTIHFICMLLRYSRIICVYAQDHKYNAEEACQAIYRGFCKLGGRPTELVIDQDAVFITTELYGEIIETATFKAFTSEQSIRLWVCNKNDPESKGPIENVVGFVKCNFFSARKITCIDDVWRSLPGWVARKNKRIHRATYRVPDEVFTDIEKAALQPLLPSLYDAALSGYTTAEVKSQPLILYKSSKYSVPREFCYKEVSYKAVGEKLHIFNLGLVYLCTHIINPCKGSVNILPEHVKEESTSWLEVCERLRKRWNCHDFQHFINGFKKRHTRHLYKQLSAVEDLLEYENPPDYIVAKLMAECCEHYYYSFSQFQSALNRMKYQYKQMSVPQTNKIKYAALDRYEQAFFERSKNDG